MRSLGVLVGSYCCSSYEAASSFISFDPFSRSSIGDLVISPKLGWEHPPLYFKGTGRASQCRDHIGVSCQRVGTWYRPRWSSLFLQSMNSWIKQVTFPAAWAMEPMPSEEPDQFPGTHPGIWGKGLTTPIYIWGPPLNFESWEGNLVLTPCFSCHPVPIPFSFQLTQ